MLELIRIILNIILLFITYEIIIITLFSIIVRIPQNYKTLYIIIHLFLLVC